MSTITNLQSNSSGSASQGIIDTNFDNLNTDKIEADSVDTLENKTIDADDNTISNLETDNIKSTAKTGVDTKVVTGTKGDTGELAMWNADGDLVSTDVTIATSVNNDDTELVTGGGVYTYVQSFIENTPTVTLYPAITYRGVQVFAFQNLTSDTAEAQIQATGDYIAFQPWRAPDNLNLITSFEIVYEASGTSPVGVQLAYDCTQPGELPGSGAAAGQTSTAFNMTYTTGALNVNELYTQAGGASFFATIAATDYVGFRFIISTGASDTIRVLMVRITYTII